MVDDDDAMAHCCAECGEEEGVTLKTCMSCKSVKYCNAKCQRNHWPKHKKRCKQLAADLRDEALFKDPPPKEDCPICFLPMPQNLICCISLPPATISSIPIFDFEKANEGLANLTTEHYYPCCGKFICGGCVYSFANSGNIKKCPFCKTDRMSKTDGDQVAEITKRVEAKDADAIYMLANYYNTGAGGLLQDREKAMELWTQATELGSIHAHYQLGKVYNERGDLKKEKFHLEAVAMAGHEDVRYHLGQKEVMSGNMEQAVKHFTIGASAGCHYSMHRLIACFGHGLVSRESINSTLISYNNSCAEMRSEARDAYLRFLIDHPFQ